MAVGVAYSNAQINGFTVAAPIPRGVAFRPRARVISITAARADRVPDRRICAAGAHDASQVYRREKTRVGFGEMGVSDESVETRSVGKNACVPRGNTWRRRATVDRPTMLTSSKWALWYGSTGRLTRLLESMNGTRRKAVLRPLPAMQPALRCSAESAARR